jgi:hypothetical protein
MPIPHQMEGVVEPSAQVYGCRQVQHSQLGKGYKSCLTHHSAEPFCYSSCTLVTCCYIGLEDIRTKNNEVMLNYIIPEAIR